MNMKKYLLILVLPLIAATESVQIIINSKFETLSYEKLMLYAQAEARHQQKMEELFDDYKDKAYNCYNKGDYYGFIYYSNYALKTGWYNNEMYYNRGFAYESLHE